MNVFWSDLYPNTQTPSTRHTEYEDCKTGDLQVPQDESVRPASDWL